MPAVLLFLIVTIGALGFTGRISTNIWTWVVVALTLFGIFTSPDVTGRLIFVAAALAGPIVPYTLQLAYGLTIRPLLHYRNWSTDSHRSLFNVPPGDDIDLAASAQIETQASQLVSSGFVRRGRFGIRVGKNTVVNEVLDRGDGLEWATLTATIPGNVQPVILHASCEFAGGKTLAVNNYPWVDPNPPTPNTEFVRLPSVDDANDIVRACLTIAARSPHGPVVAMPFDIDIATKARERTKTRYEAETRAGYLRYDATNDLYRSTLTNAYRMFWVSLPPGRWFKERRDAAREREVLAELRLTPTIRRNPITGAAIPVETMPSRKEVVKTLVIAAASIAAVIIMPDLPNTLLGKPYTVPAWPNVSVPATFAVPDSFPGAVAALEQLVGRPSHQLMGTRDDEPSPTTGVAISMSMDSAGAFVDSAQSFFLARGFYLFRTGERATSGIETDALALYPTRDPYEIMRAMDTNAANHGMLVEHVIAWFRREETRYPIQFNAIGFDYAGGQLLGDVPDESDFARRFIRFCPDIEGEGPVSARSLGREFKRTKLIFCWWD